MKPLLCIAIAVLPFKKGVAQGSWVPSGSEIANFGVVDIATNGGMEWIVERTPTPGYFSAIDSATLHRLFLILPI
jgi:hypothetical protein